MKQVEEKPIPHGASEANHGEQRSVLEVWVELHQPRFCARLPLDKAAGKEKRQM